MEWISSLWMIPDYDMCEQLIRYICDSSIVNRNHTMQSHTSESSPTSSFSHSQASPTHSTHPPSHSDQSADIISWSHKQKHKRNVRSSPILFSDPLDSPSSDAKSFDEDEMYGLDSDGETISLKTHVGALVESTTNQANDSKVCHMSHAFSLTHLKLETGRH